MQHIRSPFLRDCFVISLPVVAAPIDYINGDAAESFRVNLWLKWSLVYSINEGVSYLYRSAAKPAMCNHHLGLLFHMRFAGDLQALTAARCNG